MVLSRKPWIVASIGVLLVAGVAVGIIVMLPPALPDTNENAITLTLLDNAGVMIEAEDMRIYIDPFNLPENYSTLPADVILITHPHGDHYDFDSYDLLQTNETVCIFPANMSLEINRHDGVGVNPGDQVQVGTINITAFYMYTFSVEGYDASHPAEANWTSYIIDINGFTIFHAGDSKNIDEYEQLTGTIDVALLPLGPGCQSMANYEIVEALQAIEPTYFIPIHYSTGANDSWIATYGNAAETTSGCEILSLAYYSSHVFELDETTGV